MWMRRKGGGVGKEEREIKRKVAEKRLDSNVAEVRRRRWKSDRGNEKKSAVKRKRGRR